MFIDQENKKCLTKCNTTDGYVEEGASKICKNCSAVSNGVY